ncbi:MAG TPA: glycosyltransferase family 2 protein [Candidatus Binatia bacterium]|nr:glycosyltransferase family 2 protein [Candidatus Binatia bacterium]
MSAAPRVTAVVLNWNGTEDTVACVRSLLALERDGAELDILVVDNGSHQSPASALREAAPGVPILFTGANRGYAGGNNAGIRYAAARGADFVWILNNDAVVETGALAPLLQSAQRNQRAGVFGSKILRADDTARLWVAWGRVTWRQSLVALEGEDAADGPRYDGEHDVEWIPGCALLFRTSALAEVGGFDERFFAYHEDVDWAARAARAGWASRYVGSSRVVHRVHGSSGGASHYGGFRKYLSARNSVLYARKHGRPLQMAWMAACIAATFPFQLLRRSIRGEGAGVLIKARGWADALRGRPLPLKDLGLR